MAEFRFPGSFAQQRLWLMEQLQPGTSVYHIFEAVRVKAAVDRVMLERAVNEIVRRHESLRTRFAVEDGVPVQVIDEERQVTICFDDLTTAHEPEQMATTLARRESAEAFDLERGPLLRVRLVRLGTEDHLILVTMHHIISDGWSMEVFFEEMSVLYQAYRNGRPSPLPELTIQYGDFSEWQRNWLQGEIFQQQLDYWKKQLEDVPAVLALPTDHPRPAVRGFRGGRERLHFDEQLTAGLRELSGREGVTLFMTLLAAFQTLLWRYSGQDDVVVGTPVAGRRRPEIEPVIGFFVNTLPLRTRFEGDPSFRELLQQVKVTALAAYEHQDFPFEKIVEELNPERTLSHDPLVQVFFGYQNVPARVPSFFSSANSSGLEVDRGTSHSDLAVFLREDAKQISGILEYSLDLFEPSTVRRMVGHFERLLKAIVAEPGQRVSRLPLLSDHELRQILAEWNPVETRYPQDRCIHEVFEDQARRSPDAVAVVYDKQRLSYAELNRRANQLAHYLQHQGVGPEERVALRVERSLDMVVGLLGILKAGGAYVPVDPAYPRERADFILADAGAKILVTQERLLEQLPAPGANVVCLDRNWPDISKQSADNPVSGATANNLAYVIYTSGSTGTPKGVAIEHGNTVAFCSAMSEIFSPADVEGVLASTSTNFDLSVFELFFTLSSGGTVILVQNALALPNLPHRHAVSMINSVPSVVTELHRSGSIPDTVRVINMAGEPLKQSLVEDLYKRTKVERVYDLYGPSETTTYSTWALRERRGRETIGRPVANTYVYVLDGFMQPVPAGVPGGLYIGGAGVARGYLNRPELTAERFLPDPFNRKPGARLYRTGDRVRWLTNGTLEYLGRQDFQVKLRGFRIELGEIEASLLAHPAVREAVALVREDEPGDKRLVAYVAGSHVKPAELRDYLKTKLPEYMVPASIVPLERLPLNASGKIDRRALPQPECGDDLETFVAPRSPREDAIAEIWAEVLKRERVGIHDNFFEIGGHSLLATQLLSRMRAVFGITLPLRQVFETPTVAELARIIDQQTRTGEEPEIVRVGRDRPLPLSFSQERLWFVDQLHPGNPFYNVPLALRFRGPLNTSALEQAINEIIRRHETLRTTFSLADGNPVQVIHAFSTPELRLRDVSDVPEPLRLTEARLHAEEEVRLPFALDRDPPVRAELIRVAADDHILVITFHHIATDAWSLAVFSGELSRLYTALARGEAPRLPELPVQFADYACWQRELLDGEHLRDELEYWKRTLAGAPDLVCFRNTHPRREKPTFAGARYAVHLPEKLATALATLSRQQGVTLFMTFMAAFQILLRSYTDQQEMLIGTDLANRTRVELEPLIGFFVNLLPLRTNMDGNPTFLELLQRVRNTTMEAYAHQSLPFEKLVAEIKPGRSLNYNPLLQVLLVFTNVTTQQLHFADLEVQPFELEWNASRFDVALFLREIGSVVRAAWVYNADLFPEELIREMAARFESLLTQIVERPNERLSHFDIQLRLADDGVSGESRQSAAVPVQKLKEVKRRTVDLDL